MKLASISEIKKALLANDKEQVIELCLRLAKYKKENKELLHYLLFEANDEAEFLKNAKLEIDLLFRELNHSNTYLLKKGIRKILKLTSKYVKHVNSAIFEVDMLLHFCLVFRREIREAKRSEVLSNIYDVQLRKIMKVVSTLHEDLQYDYEIEILKLRG